MLSNIPQSVVLTLFGASGDLAKLKIFPSIFALAAQHRLPPMFFVVGFARTKKTEEEFRAEFAESVRRACKRADEPTVFSEKTLNKLLTKVHYFAGQYDALEDFEKYFEFLDFLAKKRKISQLQTHIAYFSVPPAAFQPILQNLALARGLPEQDIRVVLEKPFGEDEASARKLFHFISRFFEERRTFLLDHYLGKTAVRSILALRHNNVVLDLLLGCREIASLQVTAHETIGVEERAGYFDTVGIVKDMFQSHLTQILAMVTMSIPIAADAESFHREKYAILSALDFTPQVDDFFLGQYAGYQDIPGVRKNSKTETYFAGKLKIDRQSWYGVPIFVRTGKKLATKLTEIVIEFKKFPFQKEVEPNRLIFELQPREMIHIKLLNRSGQSSELHEIVTSDSISYRGEDSLPEHATLLLDVLKDEKLHFISFPEILASWKITDRILRFLRQHQVPVHEYPPGVPCPPGSEAIFRKKSEGWFEMGADTLIS